MRFLLFLLFVPSFVCCMEWERSSSDGEDRRLIDHSHLSAVVQIDGLNGERTEADLYLYCGAKRCPSWWQTVVCCACPCCFDKERNCKMTVEERKAVYRASAVVCCVAAAGGSYLAVTQGPSPWHIG